MQFKADWQKHYRETKESAGRLIGSLIWIFFIITTSVSCEYGKLSESERNERIAEGIFALSIFDFNNAYNSLVDAQASLPETHEDWLMVSYALAIATWHSTPPRFERIELSKDLLERIAHLEGESIMGIQARMDIARIAEVIDYPGDTKNIIEARDIYHSIMTQHSGTALGTQALLRLAEIHAEDLTPESALKAINTIESYLEINPDAEWASIAWQYLGDLYWQRFNDAGNALDAYKAADALGFANTAKTDTYLWRMGMWASQSGNMLDAVDLWSRIVSNHPRSIFGTAARDEIISYANANPTLEISIPSQSTFSKTL